MNIDDISRTFPNGFHDSFLRRIEVDYVKFLAYLTFDIDFSAIETDEGGTRSGTLLLEGLVYLSVEPPSISGSHPPVETDIQWIASDSSDFALLKHNPSLPEHVVGSAFRHWFYSSTDNNFIYVCYKSASFSWRELDG